jgi:PAS domain S-box-containing protein
MKIFEAYPGMYSFKLLPGLARFVLDQHLNEFVIDQFELSRKVNLPLLKHIARLPQEHLLKYATDTTVEYLTYLSENRAKDQLVNSFSKWRTDQLDIIGNSDIAAEDITVFNYMRGKLLKKWCRVYNVSEDDRYELMDEIDLLMLGANTSASSTFMDILKSKVEQESHFNTQLVNKYINGNVKDLMGYTREEVIGMGDKILPMLTHPDDVAALTDGVNRILNDRDGKTHVLEYRFKHASGEYKWLRSYQIVFKRDESGRPIELLGTSFEISKEKEIALALAKREAQLLEAQSIAQLGSYEWDLRNDESVNTPQLMKIFELESRQRHEEFMHNVHPDDQQKVQQAIQQSFVTGNYDCQYRYRIKGKEKVLWARGVVSFDKNEKPHLLKGTVQDITELKKMEAELVLKTQELERTNESLKQFASIASHDLKEPLRKMSMYTDMVITLEDGNISEVSQANLEKVKTSSVRMQNMIEDILDFSSIAAEPKRQIINLRSSVNAAREILDEIINEKDAIIYCENLPEVYVNPSQMRQLFQNLITNALKFSKKEINPIIEITYRILNEHELSIKTPKRADQYIEIRVADNGIGFKQEHAEKIFGLFTRLHAKSEYQGSGLGLSICKRIVENHGGNIRAESVPDEGSTFIITLPIITP